MRFEAQLLPGRCTVLFDTPATPAIVRVLQCVSPSGRQSLVSVTIFSIVASGIEGLRPRPSRTCPNFDQTVLGEPGAPVRSPCPATPTTWQRSSRSATPSAAISNALARTTSRCAPTATEPTTPTPRAVLRHLQRRHRFAHARNHTQLLHQLIAGHTTRSGPRPSAVGWRQLRPRAGLLRGGHRQVRQEAPGFREHPGVISRATASAS